MSKKLISGEQMLNVLDSLYDKSLNGIPKVSKSVDEMVDDYTDHHESVEDAAKSMIKYQIAKYGTSGFVTGLGGLITLPVMIPANIGSVLYVQLRMVAALAKMGGFDIRSDQVQTLVYACLTGSAATELVKQTGIRVGEEIAKGMIQKIPAHVISSVNRKIGSKLVTKFGTEGAVNLTKVVPVFGGLVGGAIDMGSTKAIATVAYRLFIKKQLPNDHKSILE